MDIYIALLCMFAAGSMFSYLLIRFYDRKAAKESAKCVRVDDVY